jgi:hypothetical protein
MGKTHVIDGKTYVEVGRKAEVGDKVLIVDAGHTGGKYENGNVIDVHRLDSYGIVNYDIKSDEYNEEGIILRREYRVLEPLSTVDSSQASEQVIEMLANLARRVKSLERQLADTQRNVERQAEELENAKQHTYGIERDVMDLEKRLDNGKSPKEDLIDTTESVTVPKWLIKALSKNIEGGAR